MKRAAGAPSLLVVAGEASGDRAAAAVVARLRGVATFGMGGGALAAEGMELVADLRDVTAMGLAEVGRRAAHVARAWGRVTSAAATREPPAALLVDYTEFNTRLAAELWARGTRILWYGAPQTWAWRPSRAAALRTHVDRMAVMLPFEEALWREALVDAHYVGHPALEDARAARHADGGARLAARQALGLTDRASCVALLPGSRPHEVRKLLPVMLDAYEAVRRDRASVDGRVLVASSLDADTRAWAHRTAAALHVESHEVDARGGVASLLPAFDASLVASGTASLECALARAMPIICYRVGWATEIGARLLLRTAHVGLPNILLGREAFPELLQRRCSAGLMADALARALDDREDLEAACTAVEETLRGRASASALVARMLQPWLRLRPGDALDHATSAAP